jgi:hypothetical protein
LQYDEVVKIFDIFADGECAYIYFVCGFCSGSELRLLFGIPVTIPAFYNSTSHNI